MAFIDMRGLRIGRWLVLERSPTVKKNAFWRCRCECGREGVIAAHNLRRGMSMSCGCLVKQYGVAKKTPHSRTHVATGVRVTNSKPDAFSADVEARRGWLDRMELIGRLVTWKHSVRYASYR